MWWEWQVVKRSGKRREMEQKDGMHKALHCQQLVLCGYALHLIPNTKRKRRTGRQCSVSSWCCRQNSAFALMEPQSHPRSDWEGKFGRTGQSTRCWLRTAVQDGAGHQPWHGIFHTISKGVDPAQHPEKKQMVTLEFLWWWLFGMLRNSM